MTLAIRTAGRFNGVDISPILAARETERLLRSQGRLIELII